jgi:hypothetical protein
MASSSSANLRASGVVGGDVAICGAEGALQLHRVPLRQRNQRLQRERGEHRGVRAGNLAKRALISIVPFITGRPRIRIEVLSLIL